MIILEITKKSGIYFKGFTPILLSRFRVNFIFFVGEDCKIDSLPFWSTLGNFLAFLNIADKLDRVLFLFPNFQSNPSCLKLVLTEEVNMMIE